MKMLLLSHSGNKAGNTRKICEKGDDSNEAVTSVFHISHYEKRKFATNSDIIIISALREIL